MFWNKKNKEEHRYYLLPGMGRSNRRHHQVVFRWSLAIGFVLSLVFGFILYLVNSH